MSIYIVEDSDNIYTYCSSLLSLAHFSIIFSTFRPDFSTHIFLSISFWHNEFTYACSVSERMCLEVDSLLLVLLHELLFGYGVDAESGLDYNIFFFQKKKKKI